MVDKEGGQETEYAMQSEFGQYGVYWEGRVEREIDRERGIKRRGEKREGQDELACVKRERLGVDLSLKGTGNSFFQVTGKASIILKLGY